MCRTVEQRRLREFGMIQSIEELSAKFQLVSLGERSGLGERDVEIGQGRTAQHIAAHAVGSVGRVIHGIELREAGIGKASVKVITVLEWHVGKTIRIKDKVAGYCLGRDLATARDGVGTVGNLLNCPHLTGIKHPYGRNHCGARNYRIARTRRTGVERVGVIGQLGWNVEWESGSISKDGIETPALGEALRTRGPHAIKRQIPSPTQADAMADVAVAGSVEKTRAVGGYRIIALLETGSIIEIMPVSVGEGVIDRADARIFGLPGQARFEGVVVCIGYVLEFRERAVANDTYVVSAVAAAAIEQSIGTARHHGVDVFQRRQSTPSAAHIVGFQNHVGEKIALQAQVVLVDVGSAQVRIVQIDSSGGVDWQKGREIDVRGGRLRGKSTGHAQSDAVAVLVITVTCILEGLAHIGERRGHLAAITVGREVWGSIEESRRAHERGLAVELKIIFAFQDVIENADAAAQAGLAVSGWVPGKTEARCKIFLVGEVRSGRGTGIAGKHQSLRRVGKSSRLISRNHRKTAPLGVELGRVVFVAQPKG